MNVVRQIIEIDEDLCNACGLCIDACHEGAITLIEGKAKLIRDDYCDGLGDCLPACPTGAISFVEREAAAYDDDAVQAHLAARAVASAVHAGADPAVAPVTGCASGGCPGSASHSVAPAPLISKGPVTGAPSELRQWPVQLQLVSPNADFLAGADVLLAADCCAYATGDFHGRYMRDKVTLIACPKLDTGEWTDKLAYMVASNDIASLTVTRMQVPCCGGIQRAAEQAVSKSGKSIPLRVVTLSSAGDVVSEEVY